MSDNIINNHVSYDLYLLDKLDVLGMDPRKYMSLSVQLILHAASPLLPSVLDWCDS